MKRAGRWAAPALRVIGLAGAALAILQGGWWALTAALGGIVVAFGLTLESLVRLWRTETPRARPLDFAHTVDLLRRAHGAVAGWAVGQRQGSVEVHPDSGPSRGALDRGAAIVQLASADSRIHVARELGGTYVAVGDFPYGAGLLLPQRDATPEIVDAVGEDLRRLVAGMRIGEMELAGPHDALVAKQLALVASGAQTLDGIARAGAELAQQLSQRGAVVAMQHALTRAVRVQAASSAVDQRLLGLAPVEDAAVCRAIGQKVPVVTRGAEDIFGPGVPDRRRQERGGIAYPLMDGDVAVGALVLIGTPIEPDTPLAEQIARLVAELGPRLAAARAVHDAEQRAVRDPLTGLVNRRELERVLNAYRTAEAPPGPATVIYADLDRFKQLNDTLGHAAGDSALRHVANQLQQQLRDGDLVARIGGEEFAIWLPRTPRRQGLEVAERVRWAVERGEWHWNGTAYRLTTSCGVAAYPDAVRDVANLLSAADAALYRAKQAGRNRVEMAGPGD